MSDERVGEGIARMLNQQGPRPSNQNTVTREECEAILNPKVPVGHIYQPPTELEKRLAHAHLELLDANAALESNFKASERAKGIARCEWQAAQDKLAEIEHNLIRITGIETDYVTNIEALSSQRDELRSQKAALESQLAEARKVLEIIAPYHEDCYCDDGDGITGKCLHCIILDATGALRAKPEAGDKP